MWIRLPVCSLLLAGLALAQEAPDPCLQAVERLAQSVRANDVPWRERFAAYKEAKSAVESGSEECKALYGQILPAVANALRRESLDWDGIVLGFFGATLLWGGCAVCIGIAWRSGDHGTEED